MKKIKKIISFIMALIVTALPLSAELSPLIGNSEEYASNDSRFPMWKEGVTSDGFHWELTPWGDLNILSYDGTEPDVVVPGNIDGNFVWGISDRLFADNQTIKSADLSQCHNFGVGYFENSSVESVILPKDIVYIPNDTFKNCKNLKHVEFGDNVEVIPESAFEGTDYILPDELADKVKNADCTGPYSGHVIGDEYQYSIDCNYSTGKQIYLEKYLGNDTDIVIPESIDNTPVTDVNASAFVKDEKNIVTSIVYPKSITKISISLNYPEKLKSITFNSDKIRIDSNMSELGIEEITFPLLSNHIFKNNILKDSKTIKTVRFEKGNNDLKLENNAFENCSALDTVTFNGYSSVSFGRYAFSNSALRRLEVNMDCNLVGESFVDCNNLKEIVFNGDVSSTAGVFKNCPLNNIIFDDTSVSVSSGTFNMCPSLKNLNSEPAFDDATGDFNEKYKDFIIRNFSGADDVGFINEYVMWHVKDIVARYTNDSMSDMEKAKVLHDWVCENVSYSLKTESEEHNDLSPFLTGVTVCDGYARAYNLLLHEAGIETCQVNSSNHIWNIIKIGGHYFHVDTTWDDSDKITDNWFLKSDNEMKSETSSHSRWDLKTTSSLHSFQSDVMPECPYSMGDCNMDGVISVADIVKMNRYIMGADAVDTDDLTLYDLDFSGSADAFDMIKMRKLIIEKILT